MAYVLGVVLFALGIFISVCVHEAGHMGTAKLFGMKVTRYFAGFGPTLWSFRRGETEYGLKAIPAGGFVKIVGMTPLEEEEEEVGPEDQKRVFWRKPLWQRTIVLVAGSVTHFIIGFILLWITASFVGIPNAPDGSTPASRAEISDIAPCVVTQWQVDPDSKTLRGCQDSDPRSPAAAAGLRSGDVITAVNGVPVSNWNGFIHEVRGRAGEPLTIVLERDGEQRTVQTPPLPAAQRPKLDVDKADADIEEADLEPVGTLGVGSALIIKVGPVQGLPTAVSYLGNTFTGTFHAIGKFPEKVPRLFTALSGGERDVETPISVVGASRLGGETVQFGAWFVFLLLLAQLNIFVGIFNLFPLLPLDGGHIAVAWFERVRSWWYARRGRPDPGRVDYLKLMPITYAVVIIFGGLTLLTVAADIVNPITFQ